MQHQPVSSSNIRSVGYDIESKTLEVEFTNGSRYRYDGVPKDEYEDFMGSASKGGYFSDNIKNSYPYRRV